MEGTLVDIIPFHQKSFIEFAHKHNKPTPNKEFFDKVNGWGGTKIMKYFFDDISESRAKELVEEKELIYRNMYLPHLKLINGLPQLLESCKSKGIKMAIGSSAPVCNIDFVLDQLNIREYFYTVVCEKDVTNAKPDPEIFNLCAKRLGTPKEKCLVFEDSLSGVQAGINAGIKVVGITTVHSQEELHMANHIIKDYSHLTIDKINNDYFGS